MNELKAFCAKCSVEIDFKLHGRYSIGNSSYCIECWQIEKRFIQDWIKDKELKAKIEDFPAWKAIRERN